MTMMRAPRRRMTIARLHRRMNRRFTGLENRVIRRFESIDARFNAIDARFNATIGTCFDSMEARINEGECLKRMRARFRPPEAEPTARAVYSRFLRATDFLTAEVAERQTR